MTCEEARLFIMADPENASAELQAHLSLCPQCQEHHRQILAFNSRIRRALELDLRTAQPAANAAGAPEDNVTVLPRRAEPPPPKAVRPRGLAWVSALAAGLLVGFTLWLSRPSESLAAQIVSHVEGEPGSWSKTQTVEAARLEAVLRKSGVKLGTATNPVVYASACWFRGHYVPHFVVLTKSGPATVMILTHERVGAEERFDEAGYSGLLVPAPAGAVAVVSRTPMDLEQPARDVVDALRSAKD